MTAGAVSRVDTSDPETLVELVD
ncbi:MAG: hypothetical protein QOD82_3407, partial [Pseudonocardiales bacterium]|nr:hypothetical protein [Pseudonocardiales bacterium]